MAVSVPSFGDSFFIKTVFAEHARKDWLFPSPHSGILFLLLPENTPKEIIEMSFRPLIRGFFFYSTRWKLPMKTLASFRPLIRGFFFYDHNTKLNLEESEEGFRPLIRGFFFYDVWRFIIVFLPPIVSVPSFGDSFFILSL